MLLQTYVQVHLRVLRVLAPLVVDLKISLVGASAPELFVIFQAPDTLPRLRDNSLNWSLRARNYRKSAA